jgi:hypothetical protein
MSRITISNLQTDENLLVELQETETNSIVGGSDKEGTKGDGYGKEYGRNDDNEDKYGRGGKYGRGDDDDERGRGYKFPIYNPPCRY